MPVSGVLQYLRPSGVGWLLLGAISVLLVVVPVRLHQSAEYMRQVVAAQEQLNQDMWRSLPGEPVPGLSDAMGEEGARRLMRRLSQVERQSLKAPKCKWVESDDLFEVVWKNGKRIRNRLAFPGDIVCHSLYDAYCRVDDRIELNTGTFTTTWRREDDTWKPVEARGRSYGCFSVEGILLENPMYLRARAQLKDD